MSERKGLTATLQLILIVANLCLVVIYLSGWITPRAQNNSKKIVRPPTLVKEPLDITMEHRGRSVKPNEEFEGDAEWLRNVRFRIKNNSDKVITYVVLNLTFPETATLQSARTGLHQIRLGLDPDVKTDGPPLYLKPGESKEISLDSEYPAIKKLVESRVPMQTISSLTLRIDTALFDDGIKFFAGVLYRRDRTDPHKWIPIEQ